MSYVKRNIVDRIAVGDDCFRMDKLSDGRYRLTPAPDSVVEAGTNIDKNLLQPMEDAIEELMNNKEHPVPTPSEEDAGKIIKVQDDGTYGLDSIIEIPTPTAADSGKALMVDESGAYAIGLKPATATFLNATIPTAGWSEAAPYSVEIPLEGVLSTDTPLVDIVQTGTEETDAPIREAWTLITRIVPGDGSITVTAAEELPTVEIPIHMVVIR